MSMKPVTETRIVGTFEGYRGGRVYRLADGSGWRQECNTVEHVYREDPKARLLRDDTGRTFLDVEGTSGVVWVVRSGPKPTPGAGAF
jgi:hypothetical protein